jgi:hypothetical protein
MNWKFWKKKKNDQTPPQTRNRIGYWRKANYPWYYTIIMEEIGQIGDRSKIRIIDFKVDLDCNKSIKDCKKNFGFYDDCYMLTNNVNWETDNQQYRRTRYISEEHYDNDPVNIENLYYGEEEIDPVRGYHNERHLTPHNFVGYHDTEDRPTCDECEMPDPNPDEFEGYFDQLAI